MINPFSQINWSPTDRDVRKFGLTIFIGFTILAVALAALAQWKGAGTWKPAFILLAAGLAVWGLASLAPKPSLPLYYIWFFLSACVGFVVSNLIMVMFFYLFFTPFAVIIRACTGRDPLHLRKPVSAKSYWHEVKTRRDLSSYFKQY